MVGMASSSDGAVSPRRVASVALSESPSLPRARGDRTGAGEDGLHGVLLPDALEAGNAAMDAPFGQWGKSIVKSALRMGPSSTLSHAEGSGLVEDVAFRSTRFTVTCLLGNGERWHEGGELLLVRVLAPLTSAEDRTLRQREREVRDDPQQARQAARTITAASAAAAEEEGDEECRCGDLVSVTYRSRKPNAEGELVMVEGVRRGKLCKARIVDNLDGTFTVSYFPDRIGDYNVHVKLNGRRIRGAPFDAYMRRPVVDLYGCQIDGGYAEDETEFSLQLEHKDVQLEPEEHLIIRIADPAHRQVHPSRLFFDKSLGRITVAYIPLIPGEYVLDVVSFGKHVAGCPFSSFFQPKEITFDGIRKGDVVDLPASLIYLKLGLGWTFPKGTKPLDLDASCIMMRFHHKQDHAFFKDPRSLDGSIILSGDNRTGLSEEKAKRLQEKRNARDQANASPEQMEHSEEAEGEREDRGELPIDDGVEEESLFVRLRRVSLKFTHLFFTVNVFNKGKSFESVESAFVKLVDMHTKEVLYRYELNKASSSAVLVCVLFRNGPSLWRLRIIDDACEGRVFNAMAKREFLGKYIGGPEPPPRAYEVVVKKATNLNEKRLGMIASVFPVVTFDHHVVEGKEVPVRDPMRPNGIPVLHPEFAKHSFEVVGHTNIIEISLWGYAQEEVTERGAFRKHGRKPSKSSIVTSLAGKVAGQAKLKRRKLFLGRVYYDVDLLPAKGTVQWYGLRVHPLESDDLHNLGSLKLSVKALPPPEPPAEKKPRRKRDLLKSKIGLDKEKAKGKKAKGNTAVRSSEDAVEEDASEDSQLSSIPEESSALEESYESWEGGQSAREEVSGGVAQHSHIGSSSDASSSIDTYGGQVSPLPQPARKPAYSANDEEYDSYEPVGYRPKLRSSADEVDVVPVARPKGKKEEEKAIKPISLSIGVGDEPRKSRKKKKKQNFISRKASKVKHFVTH